MKLFLLANAGVLGCAPILLTYALILLGMGASELGINALSLITRSSSLLSAPTS